MKKFSPQSGVPRVASAKRGFTLVEVLVSLALFSLVVVAAVGSLYTVNQASKRVSAMRTVLDNLNFATESMSRTIRTASNISCGAPGASVTPNCPFTTADGDNDHEISFVSTLGNDAGKTIDYKWVENGTNGEIQKCTEGGDNGADSCVAITAPEINITKAYFFVNGADPADTIQPSVTLMIQGQANGGDDGIEPFDIQTIISQRAAE